MIKLTGITNPRINNGQPYPVYIDPTRVLLITKVAQSTLTADAERARRVAADQLHEGAEKLAKMVAEYAPNMADPVAVGWMRSCAAVAAAVNDAYHHYARAFNKEDYTEPTTFTEIQLACGTALEHGVMLARVWVQEEPEAVADEIRRWHELPRNWGPADPRRFPRPDLPITR